MLSAETILVPTDFSPQAQEAEAYGSWLAERLGARLVLLHVFDVPFITGTFDERLRVPGGIDPTKLSELGDWAAKRLTAAAEGARARGVRVDTRLVEGRPAAEIVKAAQVHEASIIVMGTHGRGGLSRMLLGSVTAKVVRAAPCPVLAAPPKVFPHPEVAHA